MKWYSNSVIPTKWLIMLAFIIQISLLFNYWFKNIDVYFMSIIALNAGDAVVEEQSFLIPVGYHLSI